MSMENMMRISLTLTAAKTSAIFDPRTTIMLAYALLTALAELIWRTQRLALYTFVPRVTKSAITLEGNLELSPDLFDGVTDLLPSLTRASDLLKAAELMLRTQLADRMLQPAARLPVCIKHAPMIEELLAYDREKDTILCQISDWRETVSQHLRLLKALSSIADAAFDPCLEVNGTAYAFPFVSPTLFSHGMGPGQSVVTTAIVSGHHLIAGEIEAGIDGLRENRVVRAVLDDTARESASAYHPPYSVAIEYRESTPHLPLLPIGSNPKVVVERMWAFEVQPDLGLA